jgi:hypothetical protein
MLERGRAMAEEQNLKRGRDRGIFYWVCMHQLCLCAALCMVSLPIAIVFLVFNDFGWRELLLADFGDGRKANWRLSVAGGAHLLFWYSVLLILILWLAEPLTCLWELVRERLKKRTLARNVILVVLQILVALVGKTVLTGTADSENQLVEASEDTLMPVYAFEYLIGYLRGVCAFWTLLGPVLLWLHIEGERRKSE